MVSKYIFAIVLGYFPWVLDAQVDEVRLSIEKYIENSESNTDYTDLLDQIEVLMKDPINLNSADVRELSRIQLLTPANIRAIIDHRKAYGNFNTVYELQQVDGFDLELIKLILPFITVAKTYSVKTFTRKEFWKGNEHEIISLSAKRLEKSAGYNLPDSNPNAYMGNPIRQVLRYRGNINQHLQINLTIEKDAGEQLKYSSMFLSGNLFLKDMGRLKTLAIGDYQAAFGQGLTFGSGLAFGKSPFVLNMMRTQNGIRAYRSLNENEFLRGVGTTIEISKKMELTCFYSSMKIDGTANADSGYIGDGFSSLVNTGYHRSANELQKKDALKRQILGSHFTFQNNNLEISATAVKTNFDQRVIPNDKPYQKYNFIGNSIVNFGVDYKWFYKNMVLFGEFSANGQFSNLSCINGLMATLGKNLDISLVYRRYDKKYITSITNAIGEASDNRNENGCYAGFSLTPFIGYKLNGYADVYRFNWLRYLVDAPSGGRDILLELQYARRKSYSWYLRYRNETKQKNEEGIQHLNRMENNKRTVLRFHVEQVVSPKLSLCNRVEYVNYKLQFGKTTEGFLMFQDIIFSASNKLKFTGRLMYFDVQDYDSRLYTYESDMLYSYSVPAFQDGGTRFYFLVKYKLKRNIDIWTRFARTSYENINEIGSGYDKITGNKVTDIKIQIKWTL